MSREHHTGLSQIEVVETRGKGVRASEIVEGGYEK
jgi:hypothetical protein